MAGPNQDRLTMTAQLQQLQQLQSVFNKLGKLLGP